MAWEAFCLTMTHYQSVNKCGVSGVHDWQNKSLMTHLE